jgi:hypothetical protein
MATGNAAAAARRFDPTDFEAQIRWLRVVNTLATDVPGWGLVRVTGEDAAGRFTVAAPSVDGQADLLVVGPAGLVAGKVGLATWCEWVPVAYTLANGTPAAGETWGAAAGSHLLVRGNAGYRVVGVPSNGAVEVVRAATVLVSGSGSGSGNGTGGSGGTVDNQNLCVVKVDGKVVDVRYTVDGEFVTVPNCGAATCSFVIDPPPSLNATVDMACMGWAGVEVTAAYSSTESFDDGFGVTITRVTYYTTGLPEPVEDCAEDTPPCDCSNCYTLVITIDCYSNGNTPALGANIRSGYPVGENCSEPTAVLIDGGLPIDGVVPQIGPLGPGVSGYCCLDEFIGTITITE